MSRRGMRPPSPLPTPDHQETFKKLLQTFPNSTNSREELVHYNPPIDCIPENSKKLFSELGLLKYCETPLSQTFSDPLLNFISQSALDEFGPPCNLGEDLDSEDIDRIMDIPDLDESVKLTYENILRYSSLSMPQHRRGCK